MARSQSSSRSRSRSPRERLDRFGRVIPSDSKRSRSRSRSRDRGRDRDRGRFSRHRSRSPYRSKRSRSGSRDDSRYGREHKRPDLDIPTRNRTNIEDPAYLNARLFIGSLPSDKVSKDELEDLFKSYGKILGVSVHDRGFGFVQFEKEEDAKKAKEAENGSKLKGSVLDVKMAAEGRKGRGGPGPAGRGGGPPPRGEYGREPGGYPPRGPPGRERSPLRGGDPYDDRYRDPYARREPPPPPPRDGVDRPDSKYPPPPPLARDDPYYADPYRRPPPPPIDDPYRDPYRDDPYRRDPYRRDPFDDPYRDPYYRDPYLPPPPPKKPLPADVQIICMNKQLEAYAEIIETRLRQSAVITDIVVISEGVLVPQMVEDAARLKFLFAIIINSQNEAHKSLTLNILHGTPQEHRNMPLEDAIKLVATSFEKYVETQREKTTTATAAPSAAAATGGPPAAPAGGAGAPFVPPAADISYLLNLLADNRQLTIEEIDKVVGYLKERKDKLLVAEGRRPAAPGASARAAPMGVPAPSETTTSSAYLQQQQQELQSKILNILNGSGSGGTPSAAQAPPQAVQAAGYGAAGGLMSTGRPVQPQRASAANPLINFDNPNVQKALDNLIQSGPNLLKSIPSSAAPQQAPPRQSGHAPPPPRQGGMGGYGQQQQQQPSQSQQQALYQQYGQQQMEASMQGQGNQRSQQQAGYGAQPRQPMGIGAPQQGPGIRPRY